MSKGRCYCFTVNNYTETDEFSIYALGIDDSVQYVVAGKEVAPTTGTRHLQGFVCFKNPRSFQAVKALLPDGCHIEPKSKHSTFAQASEYCKKDGDFYESGELPMDQSEKGKLGKQTIQERWALAKAGKFEELPPEQIRIYEYIYRKNAVVVDRPVLDNEWICGPTGCGKSSHVRSTYPVFYSKPMNKWWDGYAGEDVVVLDDFAPKHGVFLDYYLKIWADHYSFNAEVKGGMISIRPKKIIITSQYPIEACFEDQESQFAISRRFKVIQLAPFVNKMI